MDNLEYKKVEVTKNKFKFEAVVPENLFGKRKEAVYKQMAKKVKIAGFRPGMAPKAEIEKEIGYSVYIETINKVIPEIAMEILKLENLNPISTLNYELSEDEKDSKEVKFTFDFLNQPDIDVKKLQNLKSIKGKVEVTDQEVINVIKNLIKSSLPKEQWEKYIIKTAPSKTKSTKKSDEEIEVAEVTEDIELNNELIKQLGYEDEKDLESVKIKVKETIINLKDEQVQSEYSSKLVEEALKAADFDIPHEFVHREMDERESVFKKRLSDLKLNEEVYLRTQGKTLEDLRNEWHTQSEKDLATDLLLINLALKEKMTPTEDDIDSEIAKLDNESKIYYKNAKNRDYLKTALTRNNGLKRLVELNTKK